MKIRKVAALLVMAAIPMAALTACGSNVEVHGVVVSSTYEPGTFGHSATWAAAIKLDNGSIVSTSDDTGSATEFNEKVQPKRCVSFTADQGQLSGGSIHLGNPSRIQVTGVDEGKGCP